MRIGTGHLRHVWRRLAHAPAFSLVAIVTLAVGIGANTAIFSVVNGVLLKPLPFEDSERLVGVWHTAPGLGAGLMNQAPSTYFTYREENGVFEDIGLYDGGSVTVTGLDKPEHIEALFVTDGTLPILRVAPALGRRFTREDDSPGTARTVMLCYSYWQRNFGADPGVIGRALAVNGQLHDIIGVLPRSFRFLRSNPAVLLPLRFNRAEVMIGEFSYQAVARLKPGITIDQAAADVQRMIPMLPEKFPLPTGFTLAMFQNIRMGPRIQHLKQDAVGDVGRVLWVLLGTVGIILLIACANVANLFLVRAEGCQRELAVRAALGAEWRRIARELLLESTMLGVAGGAFGVLLAYGGIRLLVAMKPEHLPRLEDISIDPTVLLFTLGVSLLSGLLFGLLPVLKYARPEVIFALKEGGRSSSDGRERHRARNGLVVSQIALALVLLVGSGLMIRTFQALRQVRPGFERPEEVLTMRVSIPGAEIADDEQAVRTHEQILRRLEQIPGIVSAGLSSSITMDGHDDNNPVFVEDFPAPEGQMPVLRRFKWTAANYFSTMGNPILAGRDLTWEDAYNKAPVALVTEDLAREYWPAAAAAVGRRIRESPKSPWREIVGVVGSEHDDGVNQKTTPTVYYPLLITDFWDSRLYAKRALSYAVRSRRLGDPGFLREIQTAVWSVNHNLPLAEVRTLDEILGDSLAQTSFTLVMLGIAAGAALLLGLVGIYGVISYAASQRTREIGIRMALGARQGQVSRLFLGQGLLLAGIGIAIGLLAAGALTRLMSALLFGVSPLDPATYAAGAAGLAAVALLATYLPAHRASRANPVDALRCE